MTNTTRLQIPELAASENVANGPTRINEGWTTIDNIDVGYEDFLQAGVILATDWSFTANIVGGTGALGSTANVGGTAWLPDPVISGGRMRSATAPATLSGLGPAIKPAAGKYMTIGFELAAATWGTAATVSVVSGAEKATEAEAIASPPAITAGKMRIKDVVVKNTAGVYSIVFQRDRRPWARGYFDVQASGGGSTSSTSYTTISGLGQRVECNGVDYFRLSLRIFEAMSTNELDGGVFRFREDSSVSIGGGFQAYIGGRYPENPLLSPAIDEWVKPTAGSHFFEPQFAVATGGTFYVTNAKFVVEEITRQNANNGTS